ncbi:MAG: CYTH domain-containing protein [Clostridiales bacterium]|nr:CYTH domain-containing protein [Clostridiales bacterium]
MEIERKFLVDPMPEALETFVKKSIEQGYLSTNPVVRIRKMNEEYFLTYKSSGMMERQEVELPLTKDAYEHLREKVDGRVITKERYLIPYQTWTIELDCFHGELEGMVLAEVEFSSVEEANHFQAPVWFKKEVTFEKEYHNSYLSQTERLPDFS